MKPVETLSEAIELVGGEQALLDLINLQVDRSDPQPEEDPREKIAREMLDSYHTLRTRVAIQSGIVNNLTARMGPTKGMTLAAVAKLAEAQDKLEAQTLDILELMGVDR
jgi:hypothetical protein